VPASIETDNSSPRDMYDGPKDMKKIRARKGCEREADERHEGTRALRLNKRKSKAEHGTELSLGFFG
jgi:hypothetical protein